MSGKKNSFLIAALLLATTLAACSSIPENTDINTPHGEITLITPKTYETANEIASGKDPETPEEIIPEKTTDKSPDIQTEKISETEATEKTEVTPDEPVQTAETEITSTATAADSSEKAPPVTAGENINTTIAVQTTVEPITASVPDSTTTIPEETTLPKTETQTTVPIMTVPVETTPAVTEPPLTGGAYSQRYCTEAEAEFAERVFELTNIERAKEGLPAFEKMDSLKNVALTRAWELTVEYRADHSRPDGSTCTGAFNENGIIYGAWAENIAAGQDTPEGVVEAWMNSPSHRAAILNKDYSYMGVGYYYIKDDYQSYYHFWTQEFYQY